jgi:hypothetical protein
MFSAPLDFFVFWPFYPALLADLMTFRMYQKKMLEEKKEIPIVCSLRHLGRRNVNDKIIHKRHVCERVSLPTFTVLSSIAPLLVMTELPLSASTAASFLRLFCANIKTGVVIIIIIACLDVPKLLRFCFRYTVSSAKQNKQAEQIVHGRRGIYQYPLFGCFWCLVTLLQ